MKGLCVLLANVPNQRRQTTFSSEQAAFARPLRWGCYMAISARVLMYLTLEVPSWPDYLALC
jgi:hypothetical protein